MSAEMDAFFTLHRGLPREGPGEPADVAWATALARVAPNAVMADVACGPGADIAALLGAAPQGHVTALDKTAHFVDQGRETYGDDPRVTMLRANMASIANTYDFIWCAGAVYFLGITPALRSWRKSLRPGGIIAFTEPCWFTMPPPLRAQKLFGDYAAMTDEPGVLAQVAEAGYEVLGIRKLEDAAWEAYFGPIDARIAALRPGANGALADVLDEAVEEAACWRAHRNDFGYLQLVVRPK